MSTSGFRLLPEQASTMASSVDWLFFFLCAITGFIIFLISALNLVFAIKYRRSRSPLAKPAHSTILLEISWSVIPLIISMFVFAWGADIYFDLRTPPADTLDLYGVAKQWMWKFQHPEGKREINDLHVPKGVPVKVILTSEDVIHSFFVPAFRVKMDVLPGRYTTVWFEATKAGRYHLFCTEYCGTKHSEMIGWVYVLEPEEYESWISGGSEQMSMAEAGEKLFESLACATCHNPTSGARGPHLAGLFGREQRLEGGGRVLFDEQYARESILNPGAKVTAGFRPLMPTFQGQVSEENLLRLIAYIKSLQVGSEAEAAR